MYKLDRGRDSQDELGKASNIPELREMNFHKHTQTWNLFKDLKTVIKKFLLLFLNITKIHECLYGSSGGVEACQHT